MTHADKDRIDRLVARMPSIASPVSIARAALLLGLEQLEGDPMILDREPTKRGGR